MKLYEREEALEGIARVLRAASQGRGGSILVLGDAGTGKTTLLRAAAEMVGRSGTTDNPSAVVVVAKGAPMEADLPFAFAEQFVDSILLGLDPGVGPQGESPQARRAAIYSAARAELTRWAETSPVVLLLDDLHWADLDSLELIGYLARRLSELPIAIVGALRSWPARAASLARSLGQGGYARVVETHPLSEAASAALLGELTSSAATGRLATAPSRAPPGLDPEVVRRAWRLTKGNPMLVGQAARTVAETGELPEATGANLPRLQRTLLLSHLAGLGPGALDCAKGAAVLGTRIRIGVLEAIMGMREDAFVDAFDSLVGAGVLRYTGPGTAEFGHDLLAAAIYEDTLPARRHVLHMAAFTHHFEHGESVAAAPHAVAAQLAGDQRSMAVLVEAGTVSLGEGAIKTGVEHLRAALAMAGSGAALEMLSRLADALFLADCADEALSVYERILERQLAPSMRLDVLGRAARAQAYAGDVERAMQTDRDALDELAQLTFDNRVVGSLTGLLVERAHLAWEADGPSAALAALDPVSAPRWPEPEPASISALRAYMRLLLGDRSGLGVIVQAANAARHSPGSGLVEVGRSLNLFLLHPGALAFTERFEEAHELIDYARLRYRSAGSVRSAIAVATLRASILLNQGRLFEVLVEAESVGVGSDLLGRPRLALMQAEALTGLGRLDESVAVCDLLEASNSVRSQFAVFNLGLARAQHLWAKGAPVEAATRYLGLEALARRVGIASMTTARWAAGAIEATIAARRGEDAARIATWLEEANQSLGCTWPRMVALGARAGLVASSDEEGTDSLYAAALDASTVMPLDRAAIKLRYGKWQRRSGRVVQARATLASCLGLAEELGAAQLVRSARAELSAAGGRRRAQRPSALSAQEARAAQMAALGASIREIAEAMYLSPRTVESHLAHAYAKLGVHSKSELRRRRTELGL